MISISKNSGTQEIKSWIPGVEEGIKMQAKIIENLFNEVTMNIFLSLEKEINIWVTFLTVRYPHHILLLPEKTRKHTLSKTVRSLCKLSACRSVSNLFSFIRLFVAGHHVCLVGLGIWILTTPLHAVCASCLGRPTHPAHRKEKLRGKNN